MIDSEGNNVCGWWGAVVIADVVSGWGAVVIAMVIEDAVGDAAEYVGILLSRCVDPGIDTKQNFEKVLKQVTKANQPTYHQLSMWRYSIDAVRIH